MGALHEGHISLIRRARKAAGNRGTVVVSIFVNPAQFGPGEDFAKYPRPFVEDSRRAREAGTDLIFAPEAQAMYAKDASTFVEETRLDSKLCGRSRPGHFRGVCTIVAKLFHILAPDAAVFGEKDFQQLAIIRRMVRDLFMPVRIIAAPIVRERDGLAMSSRNRYLSEAERAQAPVISRALRAAAGSGESEPAALRKVALAELKSASLAKVDYVQIVDAATLEPATSATARKLIAAAVYFGRTRLIDNLRIQ
jgi:pantoate--beta-alanine ligase